MGAEILVVIFMVLVFSWTNMQDSREKSFPPYAELKKSYPQKTDDLEEKLSLYGKDPSKILEKPQVPEILCEADKYTFEEITEEYDQSLIFQLLDHGLLSHDLESLTRTNEGDEYLQIMDEFQHSGSKNNEKDFLAEDDEQNLSDFYITISETEQIFERYREDEDTIRNVYEGNTTAEEKINWEDIPETPENFPDKPDWFKEEFEKSGAVNSPDWIGR